MQNTRTTDALQSLHAGLQMRLHVHAVLKNLYFFVLADHEIEIRKDVLG